MLVGRDVELRQLDAAVSSAARSGGGLCLLAGEPGIGKTRLSTECAQRARDRGFRASWGRCWEGGGAPALWPWREALSGLGCAFPEAGAIAATDPAEARFALFHEIARALEAEAARGPVLVALEDLHAADRSTLLALEFVASRLQSSPILILGTYRDLEASLRADASDAIARLGRLGQVTLLGRLGVADVATLVRSAIEGADDGLAARVFETTQGNPLFVDEVVRGVRARGGDAGASIPLGVREVIRQRLGLVSDETRRVLEAGAVLGVEFGAQEIARMSAGAGAVLDDAVRGGLVTPTASPPGRYRFTHALYREALYHDLPRARIEALHREAARACEAAGAPLAETAHHLLESGADAAAPAIDVAIRAAEHALGVFAYEDAAALLERARVAVPTGPDERSLRARVLIAVGEARIRTGDAAGRGPCVEAAAIARELGDGALLARAALGYGSVFTMGGVDPVLVGMLEEALARLPDEDSALRARVMARLGAARQPSKSDVRQRDVDLALEAIAMARRAASPRDLLVVLHSASGALYGAAPPSIRLPASREQERLAEELGDTTRLLHARVRIAMDLAEMGAFDSYAQLATSYEHVAKRVGQAAAPWRVPLMRSMCALANDRFDESERFQEEARLLDGESPRARRAQAFHRIGFLRAAERHADLRATLSDLRSLWLEMPYGVVLAEPRVASILARIGAADEVRAILDKVPAESFEEVINSGSLSESVWLAGTPAEARRLRSVFAPYAERWLMYWLDVEIVETPGTRLVAYLAGIEGDWDEADRLFASALAAVESIGRRAMAARMRFEMGDLLSRAGKDPDRARTLLVEARAGAAASGRVELVGLIDRRHPTLAAASSSPSTPRRSSVPPAMHAFAMVLEGEYYAVAGTRGPLRFKATRGMQYLARLVERPGVDVHVLDLAGSGDAADRGDAGELLDGPAFRAYRARLETLRSALEDAGELGDADRADRARAEMDAIAGEIAKATGGGGRARRAESAVDRARSAVQRRIKDALDRITEQDADLGADLRRAVSTGNYCRFRPSA